MTTAGPTQEETLIGGGNLTLRFCDDAKTEKDVTVRQLKVGEMTQFFGALEDEVKLVSLYTGLPVEQVQNLHPSSFRQVLEEGDRVNADFFACWDRRLAQVRRMAPGVLEKALQTPPQQAALSALPNSRPRSR